MERSRALPASFIIILPSKKNHDNEWYNSRQELILKMGMSGPTCGPGMPGEKYPKTNAQGVQQVNSPCFHDGVQLLKRMGVISVCGFILIIDG
jgi:hypothetical protein